MNKPPLKKILEIAAVLCREYGGVMGDRVCQDLSEDGCNATRRLTKEEKLWLDYQYEQYNSNGEDYDPEDDFWSDGLHVGCAIACHLEQLAKAEPSPELKLDSRLTQFIDPAIGSRWIAIDPPDRWTQVYLIVGAEVCKFGGLSEAGDWETWEGSLNDRLFRHFEFSIVVPGEHDEAFALLEGGDG